MKNILWGGLPILILLLTASSASAQTPPTRYIDGDFGSSTGNCTSHAAPCTLDYANGLTSNTSGTKFLVRVRRTGGQVRLASPGSPLSSEIIFGAYVKGSGAEVTGTLEFTGEFQIAPAGQVQLHEKISLRFQDITVQDGSRTNDFILIADDMPGDRVAVSGTLTLNAPLSRMDKLVISEDLNLDGDHRLVVNELTVHQGATLTLEDTGIQVALKRGATDTDKAGILSVDGSIMGADTLWIAGPNSEEGRGGTSDEFFHRYDEYLPDDEGLVDYKDCIRITGDGKISSTLIAVARGNLCIELDELGAVVAVGSIVESGTRNTATGMEQDRITTDLIFREKAEIDGDVKLWGDARMVFEKPVTITGNIELDDRENPFASDFGQSRTQAARQGVQSAGFGLYYCAYLTQRVDTKERAVHIPGLQFEAVGVIEGSLMVNSSVLSDESARSQPSDTKCAPRVLFIAPPVENTLTADVEIMSRIDGDVTIESDETFGSEGRLFLDSDSRLVNTAIRSTAHSLRVGRDIIANGLTIGMRKPAISQISGQCGLDKGNAEVDLVLKFGNRIVLAEEEDHVIAGSVTLDTVVLLGKLSIQSGPATIKLLKLGPLAEIVSEDGSKGLTVDGDLILQGRGLIGSLSSASVIKNLVYASRQTDFLKGIGTAEQPAEAVSILGGAGELRLDKVMRVKNLGICGGDLVLREAGELSDSTLYVHDKITVRNGTLKRDINSPGSIATDMAEEASTNDRYILSYVGAGVRTIPENALEWFDPRDVIVNHRNAVITVEGDHDIPGKLTVMQGRLTMNGILATGTSPLHRSGDDVQLYIINYGITVGSKGVLHVSGDSVIVHGQVQLTGGTLTAGGGDMWVPGRLDGMNYANGTASVTGRGTVDLRGGRLILGPELMDPSDEFTGDDLPDVLMSFLGTLRADIIVPKGSKETLISGGLGVVKFDGTRTPKKNGGAPNQSGFLVLTGGSVDSLVAENGSVASAGSSVTIQSDFELSNATMIFNGTKLQFTRDFLIRGRGGFQTSPPVQGRQITVNGNFTQTMGATSEGAGMRLAAADTLTVRGDFMVTADAAPFVTEKETRVNFYRKFRFDKTRGMNAYLSFLGVGDLGMWGAMPLYLGNLTVKGKTDIRLVSDITQRRDATLTLSDGLITSVHADTAKRPFRWMVQNTQIEEDLEGRISAREGQKCGLNNQQTCKASILGGSGWSYASIPVARDLLQGNAGTGAESGGYLFPVGIDQDSISYYRPLMLQLSSDLNDTTAATVTPIILAKNKDITPGWPAEDIVVPTTGNSLTLDVHADMFWKIELDGELPVNANIRIVAEGIQNVADTQGLRIVQWDCSWKNPKLAGRLPAQTEAGSFAVNGYLNGVVNLTQEGIGLGSCAILGIAANGIKNPIHRADLSGGRAMVQFIHNLPALGSAPVEVHLGDVRLGSNLRFRQATGYHPVGAGNHTLTIQPVGAPEEQAIKDMLNLMLGRNTVVIAHGSLAEPKLKVLDMRMESSVSRQTEVRLVHGSLDLGSVRVQVMDPINPVIPVMTLANNLMPNEATRRYISLDPSVQVMQVMSADQQVEKVYEMDLHGYGGQTLVLNLSGMRNDLTILGVDRNGKIVPTMVVTGTEAEGNELPKEFALHGNYPNPFNPSTRIHFDLPERAQVHVQIVDLLGREVMEIPVQKMEAGANRSIELNATDLASGMYLYRMIVTGTKHQYVKPGQLLLVK